MVIFHSYVKLPEGTVPRIMGAEKIPIALQKVAVDRYTWEALWILWGVQAMLYNAI